MLVAEQRPRLGHIMISATPGLRRFLLASVCAASLADAVEFPAVAGAPGPGPDCVSDEMQKEGLLGDLPVLGDLPGSGGVL